MLVMAKGHLQQWGVNLERLVFFEEGFRSEERIKSSRETWSNEWLVEE